MRFALSPEQLDFGTSLRKLFDAGRTPNVVRAWAAGDPRPGRALIKQLAEAGVLGLAVAEEHGGVGAEPIDLVVAFQEIGRAAVPGPLVETAAAIPALLQALPDQSLAARWLPGFAGARRWAPWPSRHPARAASRWTPTPPRWCCTPTARS